MADEETLYFGGTEAYISVRTQSKWAPIASSVPTVSGITYSTKEVLAVVQGWDFSFSFEYKELYGMDTIKRVNVARCNGTGEGNIEFCKFDPTVTTWWLFAALGNDGTIAGTVEDSNRMQFFEFKGSVAPFELTDETDTRYITGVTMTNARFDSLTFGGQKNEWYKQNVKFKASYMEFTNASAN